MNVPLITTFTSPVTRAAKNAGPLGGQVPRATEALAAGISILELARLMGTA